MEPIGIRATVSRDVNTATFALEPGSREALQYIPGGNMSIRSLTLDVLPEPSGSVECFRISTLKVVSELLMNRTLDQLSARQVSVEVRFYGATGDPDTCGLAISLT